MLRANLRDVLDSIPRIRRPAAKIHVFEPDRMKVFVETAQIFPYIAPRHEKCAGGLLHGALEVQIPIQVSIASVNRVPRPQAVDSQELERQGCRRGKPADSKPGLRTTIRPGKLAGCESVFLARVDQRG
jgi:hypothetical protein